jgi:hypothetical protein
LQCYIFYGDISMIGKHKLWLYQLYSNEFIWDSWSQCDVQHWQSQSGSDIYICNT